MALFKMVKMKKTVRSSTMTKRRTVQIVQLRMKKCNSKVTNRPKSSLWVQPFPTGPSN